MSTARTVLSATEASEGAPAWRLVLGRLHLELVCASFSQALQVVARVGELAERLDHHPEVDLRFTRVHLAMDSHDVGGITRRDLRLARAVEELVAELGLRVETGCCAEVEVAVDALDIDAVLPFWQAVLGYRRLESPGAPVLVDPRRIGPRVWFQQMGEPRPDPTQRNRLHVDVSLPHDEAPARLRAALAAGGRLVDDSHAPSFWVLSDAEGNEACLSTWQHRDAAGRAISGA